MPELAPQIINIFFHLFMIFVAIYSGLGVFALLRFGQSRILGFLAVLFYISLVSSIYFQTVANIGKF